MLNTRETLLDHLTAVNAATAMLVARIFLIFFIIVAFAASSFAGSSAEAECAHDLDALATAADLETNTQWTTQTFDGPFGESSQGSTIEVKKTADGTTGAMTVTFYGAMGRNEIDYAISDIHTYKVTLTQILYSEPIYVNPQVSEKSRTVRSYYVCDGDIVSLLADFSVESMSESDEGHVRRLPQYLQQTHSRVKQ